MPSKRLLEKHQVFREVDHARANWCPGPAEATLCPHEPPVTQCRGREAGWMGKALNVGAHHM